MLSTQRRYLIDGCFDGYHYGHVNALQQSKSLCDELVCGTHTDEELYTTKGCSLNTFVERNYMLTQCRFITEVSHPLPYITELSSLDSTNCSHYLHGNEDISIFNNTIDPLSHVKKANRYITYEVTKGVSTTNLLHRLYQFHNHQPIGYNTDYEYLTSILNKMKLQMHVQKKQHIHYIYHSWDLLCSVHIQCLKNYKELHPDTAIVACVSKDYKDDIFNQLERAITILSIKDIDDILLEDEHSTTSGWIPLDIPFNKKEHVQQLMDKIHSNEHLTQKLIKSIH